MNILIVKTSAIGDVTHTLPALAALRCCYPEARIDWLVEEAAADIVISHPELDRVLVSRRKKWAYDLRHGPRLATLREVWDFIRELRAVSYELIIDFQGLMKSGVLVGLARGGRKVGFGRGMEHAECSYIFLNERVPAVDMDQHALLRELHLLAAIGVPCPEIRYEIPVSEECHQEISDLLASHGVGREETLVAINPMATWETKLWPNDSFAALADRLAADGCRVVFTGSSADRRLIKGIVATMEERAVNLAGMTSLKGLAALYGRAAVVISTDTGPMHIAAAAGVPVVALFGPTAPRRTGPFGDQHRVVRVELDCSPCLKRQCPTQRECMAGISVGQVLTAAREVLALQGDHRRKKVEKDG
ncbi:MAG: lipopolysaccharide heptosyltransferase I [Desulfobacterales bacterium]|nr:lipopolysaccharide heptosyltransferase I [Desulfobacterales bacterium]